MRLASTSSHQPHARTIARCVFAALAVLAALCIAALPVPADTSSAWLDDFEAAYERGDAPAYAALLAPDFRFHFGDAENRRLRPQGWSKDEELASYTNLHRGVVRPDGTKLPRALAIDIQCAGVRTGPDPGMPGSADHRLVFVQAATIDIRFADGNRVVDTAPHAFHLVRGRVLGRTGEEAEDWFARSWIERPTEAPELLAALHDEPAGVSAAGTPPAESDGDPDVPATAVEAALPPRGLLWPNPVRTGRGVSLAFDLAEGLVALDVFDVRGRAIATVAARSEPPGRRVLAWDGRDAAGCAAPAGVYFVRARLGDRDVRHRVVVID